MKEPTYEDLRAIIIQLEGGIDSLGTADQKYLRGQIELVRQKLQDLITASYTQLEHIAAADNLTLFSVQEKLSRRAGQEYLRDILAAVWKAGETGITVNDLSGALTRTNLSDSVNRINRSLEGTRYRISITKEQKSIDTRDRKTEINRYRIQKSY